MSHGTPCWYELGTSDLDAAQTFYADLLGWTWAGAGMEGFDYRLATSADGDMVAGMMALSAQEGNPPPNWLIYFATDDCDGSAAAIRDAGGSVLKPPADIPGTGRFTVVADPQGAVFGLLQPLPMEGGGGNAFNQNKAGHGAWHELMTTDPAAALAFYGSLLGWTPGQAMDMGEAGTYQLFRQGEAEIGGIMGLGQAPMPVWLPYFGVDDLQVALSRVTGGGGEVRFGPAEVPGPALIAGCTDPQGAWFALVGPAG